MAVHVRHSCAMQATTCEKVRCAWLLYCGFDCVLHCTRLADPQRILQSRKSASGGARTWFGPPKKLLRTCWKHSLLLYPDVMGVGLRQVKVIAKKRHRLYCACDASTIVAAKPRSVQKLGLLASSPQLRSSIRSQHGTDRLHSSAVSPRPARQGLLLGTTESWGF